MVKKLQVMVVDDTITYRMILKRVVERIPGAFMCATAPNGKIAMAKLAIEKPDVILLDVEMPEMDGISTLTELSKNHPHITVVMVSGTSRSNANIVMECLNLGAMDFVTKPLESDANLAMTALSKAITPIFEEISRKRHRAPIGHAVAAPAKAAPPPRRPPPPPPRPAAPRPAAKTAAAPGKAKPGKGQKPGLLLIGSSTGGPAALTQVLKNISPKLPIPILIVQHMPPVFTASLASQLSRSTGVKVSEASEGQQAVPGEAILAMGGKHMILKNSNGGLTVSLNDAAKVNECRPAVDVLFMSAVAAFQGPILSVILTGMGRDGSNGVDALKRAGSTYCITQTKETCVVYGMPRAVDEMQLSDESLPLSEIGKRISDLCH